MQSTALTHNLLLPVIKSSLRFRKWRFLITTFSALSFLLFKEIHPATDLRKPGQYLNPSSQISHSIRRRKWKPDPMVGIGGSHSKTPSTSSLQHAAQHSHPPQRSGQPPESPQFSTSLPSPIGGGGRASNSSFSAQSQQHSKYPSRLPKLSLNTKVSSPPRPSTKPMLVSSPNHTQTLRDSKHSPPSTRPQPRRGTMLVRFGSRNEP
jgi:hypothetical protein